MDLTDHEFDELFRQGGRRIAPGIWVDRFGDLHYSVPELLALFDLEQTAENVAAVTRQITEMLREEHPDAHVVRVDRKGDA
jgi:hypothetical protein